MVALLLVGCSSISDKVGPNIPEKEIVEDNDYETIENETEEETSNEINSTEEPENDVQENKFNQDLVGTWGYKTGLNTNGFDFVPAENLYIMPDGTCYIGYVKNTVDYVPGINTFNITTNGNNWDFYETLKNKLIDLNQEYDLNMSEEMMEELKSTAFKSTYDISEVTYEQLKELHKQFESLNEYDGTKPLLTITVSFENTENPLSKSNGEFQLLYLCRKKYNAEYLLNFLDGNYIDSVGNNWNFSGDNFSMTDSSNKTYEGDCIWEESTMDSDETIVQFKFEDFNSPNYKIIGFETNKVIFEDENGEKFILTQTE